MLYACWYFTVSNLFHLSFQLSQLIVSAGGVAAVIDCIGSCRGTVRLPGIMMLGYVAAHSENLSMAVIVSKVSYHCCLPILQWYSEKEIQINIVREYILWTEFCTYYWRVHFLQILLWLKFCGNLIKVCLYEIEPFIKCPGLVCEHPFVLTLHNFSVLQLHGFRK